MQQSHLHAEQATLINVSGTTGIDFTGSSLGALVTLDGSEAAGGIIFTAGDATVTMIGGSGDDHFTGNAADNVFDLSEGGSDTVILGGGVDDIDGFQGGALGAGGDVLDLNGATNVVLQDGNGGNAGLIFHTSVYNVDVSDGTLTIGAAGLDGNQTDPAANTKIYLVVDADGIDANSDGFLDAGQNIVLNNGGSDYLLVAASDDATTAQLYRVYDSETGNNVTPSLELLGTVDITNGFDTLSAENFM